jgi:hypothetical protein
VRAPLLTLAVAAAFGCTTLRAPAGSVDGPLSAAPGIVADPQVELWLESTDAVPQQDADEAQRQARAVLATAIAERPIRTTAFGAVDPVVVVRERAVARTSGRKNAQTAAKVGLVVGFVAVAVAAVLAVVKGGHGGGSGNGSSSHTATATTAGKATAKASAKAAPAGATARIGRTAAPRVAPRTAPMPTAPARPRPIPVTPHPVPLAPVPAPHYFGPVYGEGPWHPWIAWNFGIFVDLTPDRYPAPPADVPPPPDSVDGRIAAAPPPPEDDAEVDPDAEPPPPPRLELPPFAAPDMEHRGFFDGDEIRLQVAVLDRATGRLLWVNESKTDGDPRDRSDVEHALDEVFADSSWAAR